MQRHFLSSLAWILCPTPQVLVSSQSSLLAVSRSPISTSYLRTSALAVSTLWDTPAALGTHLADILTLVKYLSTFSLRVTLKLLFHSATALSVPLPGLSPCSFILFMPLHSYRTYSFIMLACVLSCFSPVQLCATLWTVACQATLSWDSLDMNTGVGCHALLRGSSWPRDWTRVSYVSCTGATWEAFIMLNACLLLFPSSGIEAHGARDLWFTDISRAPLTATGTIM